MMDPATAPHDAQRELEQRALRNVRGLVDKMESIERLDQGAQRRMLLWIVLGALAAVVFLAAAVTFLAHRQSDAPPLVIESVKSVRPAPPAPQ